MKIHNITINKYKAFVKEEKIPIDGSNIFIYGENGSGKSSFYYALKDFFQSSVENIPMAQLRNFNLADGEEDCSIKIEFENEQTNVLSETRKDTNTTQITDANRLKSFLTYKHLIGVHSGKINEELNVFSLVITGVLKHFKSDLITGGFELSKLYEDTVTGSQRSTGRNKYFHFVRQKVAFVNSSATLFNNALNKLFLKPEEGEVNYDYLAPEVNFFLSKFYGDLNLEFKRQTLRVDNKGNLSGGKLFLELTQNGVSLDTHNPHFALNESKLSAIAISIFLGAIKRQSPFSRELKILFLDDILIGLDNENRLKLLELLKETDVPDANKVFKDFQIFITTYDRHWYEVAKLNLPNNWKFIEFYKSNSGPQIIHNNKTALEKARAYFDAFDFPACANYLRKECERLLLDKLVETYTVGDGLKGLIKPPKLETLIDRLKIYYIDLGIEPPSQLISSLQNYKSILFNPMSHSDIESPIYRNDLELAFQTIQDLEAIVLPKRTLVINKGTIFNLSFPAINYIAQVEIAKDIYIVENNATKTETPITFFFKTWTREGVLHAVPKGSPPAALTNMVRLEQVKADPFQLDKAVTGLNVTFSDRGVTNINEADLLMSLTLDGDNMFNIIDKLKS